ncbi:hypothetical protein BGX31_005420 [Mortierella sp. GBA43]|nr:hypothetical protein BGX31_005420 [Mortierella sp. GBA43]
MLTPAPAGYQSASDPIGFSGDNILIPTSPTASDASWPSPPASPCSFDSQTQRRTRSKLRGRASNHSRQRHHHSRRPSKQFVATTSSAIFGDWDIELRIDHRTLARSKSNGDKAVTAASSRAEGGGGTVGRGGSLGGAAGSGVPTMGPSETYQPQSTLPSSPPMPASLFPTAEHNNDHGHDTTTKCHPPWRKKNTKGIPSALTTSAVEEEDETMDDTKQIPSTGQPTARTGFLKAISRFKNKHLQQKRRASQIIPPIQLDETNDKIPSIAVETAPNTAQDHLSPDFPHEQELLAMGETVSDGTASLRVKLRNKVHGALSSMKSSSNLRDKAKSQLHPESAESPSPSEVQPSLDRDNGERRDSALVMLPLDESELQQALKLGNSNHMNYDAADAADGLTVPQPKSKHRHSKTFWTFPRIRHESGQQRRSWEAEDTHNHHSKSDDPRAAALETEDGSMLHQQMQELKVEEMDSDKSLDIILPEDYEDYTLFAELPLKKRKKMERSLAAAAAGSDPKRPSSMRASADAVKRLLKKQDSAKNKEVTMEEATGTTEVKERDMGSINGNKKRLQGDGAEGSSKRSGQLSVDWRRSLMKSLHLNKGTRKGAQDNARSPSPLAGAALTEEDARLSGEANSVHTTRSMSLTTSTHPALLATTVSRPKSPGLRRETLEMAMRRRRSTAIRLNNGETEIPPPLPLSSEFFGVDNISTTNITHTFTSFTLELAEMHARDVVNNSATPGLFNFKRRATPRLTVSSNMMELDTDHDFKGFDSDGDAISGYTGDADISMDEIHATPLRAPVPTSTFRTRAREFSFGAAGLAARRKISSIDGDSDTVPELPKLVIRTRDLNLRGGHSRENSGSYSRLGRPMSGSSFDLEQDGRANNGLDENLRSPRRSGPASPPALTRKSGRSFQTSPTSPLSASHSSSLVKTDRAPMSLEEIASWRPRNMHTSQPLRSGISTTLISLSSHAPNSASTLTQSPVGMTPTGSGAIERGFNHRGYFHQQSTSCSSTSSQRLEHQHQMSGDTLVPSHLRYVSSGSVMSANSAYTVQPNSGTPGAREFDPSEEFPPTTPADLKAMDFETLLEAAEKEQSKGWEDLMTQKKGYEDSFASPTKPRASIPMPMVQQFPLPPTVAPLRIGSSVKSNRSSQHQLQPLRQLQQQQQRASSIAFDMPPSDDGRSGTGTGTGTGTGSDRSMRTRRVMKKKMSVIRLAGSGYGNVHGRREDDGMIRVCVSPIPYTSGPSSHTIAGRW